MVLGKMSQRNAELHTQENPAVFPGTSYATWSPSNRDGRRTPNASIEVRRCPRNYKGYSQPIPFEPDTQTKITVEVGADPIYLYVKRPLRGAVKESSDPDQEDEDRQRNESPCCSAFAM